jgi:hypothetical protein
MTVMCDYEPNNVLVDLIANYQQSKADLAKITAECNNVTAAFIAAKPPVPLCIRYIGPPLTKLDLRFEYRQMEVARMDGEDVQWLKSEYWTLMRDPERAAIAAQYHREYISLQRTFAKPDLDTASDEACDKVCDVINSIFSFDPKSVADVRLMLEFINDNIDEGNEDTMPDSGMPDGFEFTLIEWLQRFLPPARPS